MATTDYGTVLNQARRLAPEERRQLCDELVAIDPEANIALPLLPPASPLTEEERARLDAWFSAADELAAKIGAVWKDDMNAADAVKEQRRELLSEKVL